MTRRVFACGPVARLEPFWRVRVSEPVTSLLDAPAGSPCGGAGIGIRTAALASLLSLLVASQSHALLARCIGGGRCNDQAIGAEAVVGAQMISYRDGTLSIADNDGYQVRERRPNGLMHFLARPVGRPLGIERDQFGWTFFTTADRLVFAVNPGTNALMPVNSAGMLTPTGLASGPPWPGDPSGVVGRLYLVDQAWTNRAASGLFTLPWPASGSAPTRCGPAGQLWNPGDVDLVRLGGTEWLYVADNANAQIKRIRADCAGSYQVMAGSGARGWAGDGGPATAAQLNYPTAVDVLTDGSLYIADAGNHRVRFVDAGGVMHTVMGNGSPHPSPLPPDAATNPLAYPIVNPLGVAYDEAGGVLYTAVNATGDRAIYCLTAAGSPPTATLAPPAATLTATAVPPTRTATWTPSPARTCNVPCV